MKRLCGKGTACYFRLPAWLRSTNGTEIIEFAVSLPLLIVLVVAIYDFGSAFTLKQKLTGAVREGARLASSQLRPQDEGSDCGHAPAPVCAIREVVADTLTASNVNACALGSASAHYSAGTFAWTFDGACNGMTLKIERGAINPTTGTLPAPFDITAYHVQNTKITLIYPYQWQFNQVFRFFDRRASYLSSTITVTASMQELE
jgi:Flp pilus assembly protein TadG